MTETSFNEAKSFSPNTANFPYEDFILDNKLITSSLSKGLLSNKSPPKITISTCCLFNVEIILSNLSRSFVFLRLISLIKTISKSSNSFGNRLLLIVVLLIL